MKKTILKNIIPIAIVFIGLGVGLSVHYNAQASRKIKDAYVTVATTKNCVWVLSWWGAVCDANGNKIGMGYSWKGDCGTCPASLCHTIYNNTCGGTWCTNSGPVPANYTKKTATYCHYIKKVTEWSSCSDGVKVAVKVRWAKVKGTTCSNVSLNQSCLSGNGSGNGNGNGIGDGSSAVCGNNLLETGEQCDDGNTVNGDGCSSTCLIEGEGVPVCGNGIIETGEQCDGGTYCNEFCQTIPKNVCGNGVLEKSNGEQCDDGNLVNGDGCNDSCQIEEGTNTVCGDGVCSTSKGENFLNCPSDCTVKIIEF